ncbi:sialidase family protein [Streptomyces sp. CA-106110]|uniref:sialidase family protein n=1 Tax=Streptomyces sp. CA-106110 TaxID=3240044 RepID=UPI003D8A7E59
MRRRSFVAGSGAVMADLVGSGLSWAAPSARRAGATAVPVDVRVTDDGFGAHIEPVLAVNPRVPHNLLAACRVFTGTRIGLAAYASFDGGATWRRHGLMPGLVPDFDGNPTVAFDEHGNGYVCGAVATQEPSRHGDARLWRTADGGRSFDPPVTVVSGGPDLVDHPWLAIGRGTCGRPAPLYVAARMYGSADDHLVLARSLDGGLSFAPPVRLESVTGTATASVLAVAPDGTLTAVYLARSPSDRMVLRAVSSRDHGENFTVPADLAEVVSTGPGLGDVTIKSGPSVAVAPRSGRIGAAVTGFDDATGRSSLLLIVSSGSGGPTRTVVWAEPVAVAASDETVYLQPQLAADDEDRIALSVYALSIAAARIDVLLYISEPLDSGSAPVRFGAPLRVTTRSFEPRQAVNTGDTRWLGNYQGLAAARSQAFHPIWTDTRTGDTQIFTAAVRRQGVASSG